MDRLNPWVAGSALAVTLAIVYALCAAALSATLEFFNTWFHGVDLRILQPTASAFTLGVFLYGLSGIVLTGFVTGAIYAVMVNLLRRCPGCL